MKIALVSPYDYPYPGGVTEHIAALDKHFRAMGHDTRIIAASSTDEDVLDTHVIKVGDAVALLPFAGSRARISLSPNVYRRAKEILNQEKFDVVHVHEPTVPMLSLVVLKHSKALNVGTFHAYRESNAIYEYMRPLVQSIINRLDGRICVSETVREYISHYFPGASILIPNGIDYTRFSSPDIQPIEQFTDGRPNILFVGRMEKRKGFRHLIRAFALVKESIPDVRLLVVGAFSDTDKAPFVRYVRAHKLRGVHFIGYVPPEDLPRYYRTATVYCAPSIGFESFGTILLEAMAAGVPIVASDIAGYRAVLQNRVEGLLVPPADENTIALALMEILQNPDRSARMIQDGKLTAARYDWNIIARRTLDYYDHLVSNRQRVTTNPSLSRVFRLRAVKSQEQESRSLESLSYQEIAQQVAKVAKSKQITEVAISKRLRVFLCHSSHDKPFVRRLYRQLISAGFDPWLDEKDLLPGQDWQQEIPRAVRTSDVIIVCISYNAITKTGYFYKEIKYALDAADQQPEGTIFIIPLRIEECDVPERLQRWQWVNLFEEDGFPRLKKSLDKRAQDLRIA